MRPTYLVLSLSVSTLSSFRLNSVSVLLWSVWWLWTFHSISPVLYTLSQMNLSLLSLPVSVGCWYNCISIVFSRSLNLQNYWMTLCSCFHLIIMSSLLRSIRSVYCFLLGLKSSIHFSFWFWTSIISFFIIIVYYWSSFP